MLLLCLAGIVAEPAGAAIPIELNEGDIFVNAPVGVIRPAQSELDLDLYSAQLGVLRERGPQPPPDRFLTAPTTGVQRGPGIRSVTPDKLFAGEDGQSVLVEGVELAPATVVMVPDDGVELTLVATSADGSEVEISADVDASAQPGLRRLELLDSDGVAIPPIAPDANQVLIRAPRPRIESITPNHVSPGQTFELTIRGENLRGLPSIQSNLSDPYPWVSIAPDTGVAVGSSVTVNDAGTRIDVPISIAEDASAGERLVQVETRSGISIDTLRPANTLKIAESSLRPIEPLLSPVLGVTRQSTTATPRFLHSREVGVARGAVITALEPDRVMQGQTLTLSIHGQGLATASAVAVVPPDGIVVHEQSFQADENRVEIDIEIMADAPTDPRRIELVLGQQRLVAPQLLKILQPAPVVQAITPKYVLRNGSSQSFVVQGENLVQVDSARFIPDDGLIFEDFTPLGNSRANMTLRASSDAPLGTRVLQLTSGEQQSTDIANEFNTLHVVDEADIADRLTSAIVGVSRPLTTDPAVPDQTLASAVIGVARGAVATSLEPDQVQAGQTVEITISGRELPSNTSVSVEPESGVLVEGAVVSDDSTELVFDLLVGSDAEAGPRTVLLHAGDRRIDFAPLSAGRLTIDEPGDPGPIAHPDHYQLAANGQLQVEEASGVLDNDEDPAGQGLVAVLTELPRFGGLQLSSDGSFVYTPNADFVGQDEFRYAASDGNSLSGSARVSLDVEEVLDAVDDRYSVEDNALLSVSAVDGLLANDQLGVSGDIDIELIEQPQLGSLSLGNDGAFEYQPHGQAGIDRFTYRLVAAGTRSLPATVTIEVIGVNDPPVASNDQYVLEQDEALEVNAAGGVLANDSDPDGDSLTARVLESPSHGSLVLTTDGAFSYQPDAGFAGEDAFVYEVSDPEGLSDSASVTLVVNDALLAVDDFYEPTEDEILAVGPENGLLANDSAIAQGTLEIVVEMHPGHGTVEVSPDGGFVYRPTTEHYNGTDPFTYFLRDDRAQSQSATVVLEIRPVNDPPVAFDDRFQTDENVELSVAAPGVLANDSDVEAQSLIAELVTDVEHGVLVLDGDGGFSYVPDVNFRGLDSFVYAASDADGARTEATVEISVTQPPTATNDVYFVEEDTTLSVDDPDQGLLANDHDAPEDDPLVAKIRDLPLNGNISLKENGTFVYQPDAGFVGIDTFTYQASDGNSDSNVATVTFPVGITSFPMAVPDHYEMDEDSVLTVNAEEGLLINDQDADTPQEELSAFLVGVDYRNNSHLDVTVNEDGSFRVEPWKDFFGETFFIYQVFDGTDISNAAVVTIEVHARNDGVTARDDEFSVLRNTLFSTGKIVRNDDFDGDFEIAFEVVDEPSFGALSMDSASGRFDYMPDVEFSGTDSFTYRIYQVATGIEDEAVVTLRVNAPPETVADFYTIVEDSNETVVSPLVNDSDPDGDPISFAHSHFTGRRPVSSRRAIVMDVSGGNAAEEAVLKPDNHFYGETVINYRITDGFALSDGKAHVTVEPVPDAPEAFNNRFVTPRNTSLVVNDPDKGFLGNDFDPDFKPSPGGRPWQAAQGVDLEPLEARLLQDVDNGELAFSSQGTFLYTPDSDFSGTDRFVYEAVDATGRVSDPATVEIVVNTEPLARDDSYAVDEDVQLEVGAEQGLLANDEDPDNDSLRARPASSGGSCGPCNGKVRIQSDGSFGYTPDLDFHGQDRFFYRVDDGINAPVVAEVTIAVLPVNDAPRTEADTYRTREDAVLDAPEPQGVLRNDREVDGDGLVDAERLGEASHGSVELQPDGAFTYVPEENFSGTDEFIYRVYDTTGLHSDERVVVEVTPVNDAPVAVSDEYETSEAQPLSVGAGSGVLANDHDVDSESLTAAQVSPADRGLVTLEDDGSFEYQPDQDFSGVDQFTYQVSDELGAVDSASVTIVVNPVESEVEVTARNDSYSFQGPALSIVAPGVLANDAVENASGLTANMVDAPEVGSLDLASHGGFDYVAPDGFEGTVGFSYAATAEGVTDTARVRLHVTAADNNPPRASGEEYIVIEDQVFDSAAIAGLLANDSDFEGDPLSVIVSELPERGVLELFADGNFIYRPDPDYFGADRIVYRVSDGQATSEAVEAAITVLARNDTPVAQDDSYSVVSGDSLSVPVDQGLLSNDSDVDDDALFIEAIDEPAHGRITVEIDGSFIYQPDAGFSGMETFDYAVTDQEAVDIGQVNIAVQGQANAGPIAQGESYSIEEDTILIRDDSNGLLANDEDPDGDPLSVVLTDSPAQGDLSLAGGAFEYHPQPDFFGTDRFRYRVSDGELLSDEVEATIEILPVNDAPEARTDYYSTDPESALSVGAEEGLLDNDSDVEGDLLLASVEVAPSHGELVLGQDGAFEYQPDSGFVGRDEFLYRVDDGSDASTGRAIIDVQGEGNHAPVATGEQHVIPEDSVLDTRNLESLLSNDRDPDGDALELIIVEPPEMGSLDLPGSGHVIYTPEPDAFGSDRVVYRVGDEELESREVELQIIVLAVDDPPRPVPDAYVLDNPDESHQVPEETGVLANDDDPDGGILVAKLKAPPDHGDVQLSLDGSFEYVPDGSSFEQDRWTYIVVDPSGLESEASVIMLTDEDDDPFHIFSDSFGDGQQ